MRTVLCTEIIQNVKEMCIEANHFLSSDMKKALELSPDSQKLTGEFRSFSNTER